MELILLLYSTHVSLLHDCFHKEQENSVNTTTPVGQYDLNHCMQNIQYHRLAFVGAFAIPWCNWIPDNRKYSKTVIPQKEYY